MAIVQEHIRLAQSLPPRLLQFFKRYPPLQHSSSSAAIPPRAATIEIAENTSSSNPNIGASTTEHYVPPTASLEKANDGRKRNPFLPFRNPSTGAWHGPHYSLRRQAELFKLATAHHVMPLMPISPKHPEVKEAKRMEHRIRVQGTGEGRRVKGKKWERTLKTRLEIRRKAMEAMPDMINVWRERGHGRGWKKYPRGKAGAGMDEVFNPEMRHAWVRERAPSGM